MGFTGTDFRVTNRTRFNLLADIDLVSRNPGPESRAINVDDLATSILARIRDRNANGSSLLAMGESSLSDTFMVANSITSLYPRLFTTPHLVMGYSADAIFIGGLFTLSLGPGTAIDLNAACAGLILA